MRKIKNSFRTEPNEQLLAKPTQRRQSLIPSFKKCFEQLRSQIDLPFKLKVYFSILETALKHKYRQQESEQTQIVPKAFLNAFSELSEKQKQNFLCQQIHFIKSSYENRSPHGGLEYSEESAIKSIETECQIKKYMAGLSYWTNVKFSFSGVKRNVKIGYKNKVYVIDLRLYLVRKSRNEKTSLVLMKCSKENPDEAEKMAFSFHEDLFTELYREIHQCILSFRNQKLLDLVRIKDIEKNTFQSTKIGVHERTLVFLDSRSLGNYLERKQEVLEKIKRHEYDFSTLFKERNNKILISNKMQNWYKLQSIFNCPQNELKQKFLKNLSNGGHTLLAEQQILQEFSKKYFAVYQRYQINGKLFEGIMIKQQHICEHSNHILFLKGVHTPMNDSFVDFLAVKIQALKENSKLVIIGIFKAKTKISADQVIPFLLEFSNMLEKNIQEKVEKHLEYSGQFQTIINNKPMLKYHEMQSVADYFTVKDSYSEQEDSIAPTVQLSSENIDLQTIPKDTNATSINTLSKQNQYLLHRFPMKPIEIGGKLSVAKSHPAFTDWARKKHGGLICVNEEKLNIQKSVTMRIISNIRKLLMSGKSILNISLPVAIFSEESHLTTIGKSFAYAPRIIQPAANQPALQKIKHTLAFIIATGLIGISISKPFNPILGETAQIWIDNCPMYLQQVSHHPAITYYNFYGRGYRLHGAIKPQAKVGLNSIVAGSPFLHYITFDNGDQIMMIHPTMQFTGGFLFGDREFVFTEKIWAFDKKNLLFGVARYGPRNKGIFTKSSDPLDYVQSSVYEVTPQFAEYFDIKNPYPSKHDIVRELSRGEGTWTQEFIIDDNKIIDFQNDFPCEVVEEEFPLPSNGFYREDIQKFIEGDVEEAQNLKDQLEQIQRRDKKLREKMAKKSH